MPVNGPSRPVTSTSALSSALVGPSALTGSAGSTDRQGRFGQAAGLLCSAAEVQLSTGFLFSLQRRCFSGQLAFAHSFSESAP